MDDPTALYYEALSQLDFAKRQHNYRGALIEIRNGLRHSPAALESMHSKNGWLPPSIPFIEDGAGAIAALAGDIEIFDQMEVVNDLPIVLRKVDVARYRRDAQMMQAIRVHLATTDHSTLPELKALFTADDAARMTRTLNWMEKWGDLTKVKVGSATVLAAGKPEQLREETPPAFRAGMALQEPRGVLRCLRRPTGKDNHASFNERAVLFAESSDLSADTEADEWRLKPADRQPLMTITRTSAGGSWLLAQSKQQPDGTFTTAVSRYLPDGTRVEPIVLPHRVKDVMADANRPEIITIDKALNVRVYNFGGDTLAGLALAEPPEIKKVYDEALGLDDTIRVRAIDVLTDRNLVVFAYADVLWAFNLDGTPITTIRVPAMPSVGPVLIGTAPAVDLQTALVSQGLSADASPREIAEWLDAEGIMPRSLRSASSVSVVVNVPGDEETDDNLFADIGSVAELDVIAREIGGLTADWIYYLKFAEDGETLWVSTYSGLLARVRLTGEVVDSWFLPSYIDNLWVVGGRTFIAVHATVAELVTGDVPEPFWKAPGYESMYDGRRFARRQGRFVFIGDVLTGLGKTVKLARDFRAVYPTSKGVRIETTNTFADVHI